MSAACGVHYDVPSVRARDARFGFLAGEDAAPAKGVACTHWVSTIAARDPEALTHVSYPETDPQAACFVPVRHDGDDRAAAMTPTPRGCAFPSPDARARMTALADALERWAAAPSPPRTMLFDCALPLDDLRASAAHDARVLRSVLADANATWPYAAVVVPGHGLPAQDASALLAYRPNANATCASLGASEYDALGAMMPRTRRAAALLRGGVAPIAIVSGGAVHSRLVEAFAMLHLMTCGRDEAGRTAFVPVPAERVLVEPCADHTHTNLRNAARWLDAMGARAGYVVTDDAIQSKYLQEEGGFELVMGSIDQRSLRDWGYVIGAWRQASIGLDAGFWFTPYRFWAEPRDALGSFTCVDVR